MRLITRLYGIAITANIETRQWSYHLKVYIIIEKQMCAYVGND